MIVIKESNNPFLENIDLAINPQSMKNPVITIYVINLLHNCKWRGRSIFLTNTGYKLSNDSESILLITSRYI
jgi:hypothetical protein